MTLGFRMGSVLLTMLWLTRASLAEPVVLGLQNNHPLTEIQIGELLLDELRCTACHQQQRTSRAIERTAPDLSNVGVRVSPDYLQQFIAAPSKHHAGTTMPDMLADKSDSERQSIATAITHFLVSQSAQQFRPTAVDATTSAAGKELFHRVGCVACHAPRGQTEPTAEQPVVVDLEHLSAKYSVSALSEFLSQPTRIRTSGRMPDMKLSPSESLAIAGFLLGNKSTQAVALQPQAELVAAGKKHFQSLNCTACHQLPGLAPTDKKRDWAMADFNQGCLSNKPGPHPQYNLKETQNKAIQAALKSPLQKPSDQGDLHKTLTAFNCIACHIRDEFGGVSEERNSFFQSDAKNLGEDARIPPPLTLVGAKLHTVWLKRVLYDGESVRPYMFTRMPQYGESNLRHVPDLVARLDSVPEVVLSIPNGETNDKAERERAKEYREAGKKLLGSTSLNCVACHNFNAKTPQNNGIELMTTHQRIKPSWFYHFLCNPNNYRPRIVMPTAWPDGKAVDKTVLEGDTQRQIEAIWYYLSLGRSAPDPAGVQPIESKILVTDQTRTYRGRSSVAGFRGIAVGFPGNMSYAFNAETGTLTAIWSGEFIRVDRSGQGTGSFNPASKHHALAQDVSFFRLADDKAAWPLRPVLSSEVKVNPDPLYPKNCGYQFRGYTMDEQSIPTFEYVSGDVVIADRVTAEQQRLTREFTFTAPTAQTLWFRALTGKFTAVDQQTFKNDALKITVPAVEHLTRSISAENQTSELILKLNLPAGKSKHSITYELLK
jgi:mono/diheme cytochrome c family protein